MILAACAALVTLVGCDGKSVEPNASTNVSDASRREAIREEYEGYRQGELHGVPEISATELGAIADTGVTLVDCRSKAERDVSIIPGAISKDEFERVAERSDDRTIITYCTIGLRSGQTARDFNARGFDARNLIGGVLAWAHDGGTFVKPDSSTTKRVHVYGPAWDLLPVDYESVF